jgi:methane/ammonia monooxygenase subunit B
MNALKKTLLLLCGAISIVSALAPLPVLAHGERATEPYIRTRSIQWYDVKWTADKIKVNETITVTGKFHLMADWPDAVTKPDLVFMSNASPGAVLTRVETYISDVPAQQSIKGLELGRDYSFKMIMKGRIPGRWHFHPMLNVSGAGPIVGPGSWVEVTGNAAEYRQAVTTIDGTVIEDTQNYGVARVVKWQAFYILIAVAWLLWWLRRPLIIPRYTAIEKGREDLLVTRLDDKVAAGFIVVILLVVIFGYINVQAAYPRVVPLQAGSLTAPALPQAPSVVKVTFKNAEYDVPGRSLRMNIEVTNNGSRPVRIGEFMTASLRFVNGAVPAAVAGVDPAYPKELVPVSGLVVAGDTPMAPGETRMLKLDATDAAWELERLVGFLSNVDSRVGALLFFFDDKGTRHITTVAGPVIPVFKKTI